MADLIDRQAAIDAIEFGITYAKAINKETGEVKELFQASNDELRKAEDRIKQLPSAQPEIVRCEDCRWWDKSEDSPFGYCMAMKHGYMSANWEIGIYRRYKGDFYCADAERRADE